MRFAPALLLPLLACADAPKATDRDSGAVTTDDSASPDDTGDNDDTGGTDDTGDSAQTDEPLLTVDVLVIGAGPAGLSAAWEANEAGASVLVLDMDERAGGGGWYGQLFFAVNSPWQRQLGIQDSIELASGDWAAITQGGDPADPWVQTLLQRSTETVQWLVEQQGAQVTALFPDPGGGSAPRMHQLLIDGQGPIAQLADAMAPHTWLQHRVHSLVEEQGAVTGAWFTDLRTGEQDWIRATSTVVATGGFARDTERLLQDRPDLDGASLVFEIHPTAQGLGHALLDALAVPMNNPGAYGVYAHATEDPALPGEALWLHGLFSSLIVDTTGQRVASEVDTQTFAMSRLLTAAPDKRLLALFPAPVFEGLAIEVPPYNRADPQVPELFDGEQLIALGGAERFDSARAAALAYGVHADTLQATVQRYDELAAQGIDHDFGKDASLLTPFGDAPVAVVELSAGAAKAFGGVGLDPRARVIGPDGQPIPGLFAAGEVAGMLGTSAVGEGFPGSVTACYLTGRVAGASAAAAR